MTSKIKLNKKYLCALIYFLMHKHHSILNSKEEFIYIKIIFFYSQNMVSQIFSLLSPFHDDFLRRL